MNKGLVITQDGEGAALTPFDWLKRDVPLGQLKKEGLPLRPEDVEVWGLRMADVLTFDPEGMGYRRIVAVNGEPDPEACRNRPNFMEDLVESVQLEHASREIAIDCIGSVQMRLLRILAPVGLGPLGLVTGPSESGKTWLMRDLTRALIEAEPDGHFILLDIGERVADVDKRLAIVEGCRVRIATIEHFSGFQKSTAINNAIVALGRAHRLAEHRRKVFLLLDSLWGLVLALSRLGGEGGFAGKGVPNTAIELARSFLFAGSIKGGGCITVIATSLDEGEGSRSRVVLDEVGWQNATFKWALRRERPDVPRPWVDPVNSRTRELEDMLSNPRFQLHTEITQRIWKRGDGNPRRALDYAIELAQVPGTWDEAAAVWRERWAKEDISDQPEALLGNHEDYHQAVVLLTQRLRAEGVTGRAIGSVYATRRLYESGVTLEALEAHLRAGGTPSDLYKGNRR